MDCPHCESKNTRILPKKTQLGYDQFKCRDCTKQFNERTGTPFNYLEYRSEIVMLAIHYYYRFKTSLNDVVELMAMRNIFLSHQTVHNWVQTFGVELGLKLREIRKGKVGDKWNIDATYIKLNGEWCYLYRAIDREGNLVDVYLSQTRDQKAAEAFFNQAIETTGVIPKQVTTDKEPALYPAIENTFGESVEHRDVKYLNNLIEQEHRGIKSRYKVMKGFKSFMSALIFCTAFEEIRQFFKSKARTRAEQRGILASKFLEFNEIITA